MMADFTAPYSTKLWLQITL